MAYLSSIIAFSVVIIAVIVGDILCGDVTNTRQAQTNAWPQLGNTYKNQSVNALQWQSSLSTTPWPALGQPRPNTNMRQGNPQHMRAHPDSNPAWVKTTSSPNKVANNQRNVVTVRNSANYNTNFLNGERGLPGSGSQSNTGHRRNLANINQPNQPNQGSNMNVNPMGGGKPNYGKNINTTPKTTLVDGGGRDNQNNNMNPTILTGPTQNQNQESTAERTEEGVEDYELREFSEELLSKDINNAARHVTVNVQVMTTSRSTTDEAPLPLLSIDSAAYNIPSIEKLILLYNNYILETSENEVYTAQEKIEENNLLDTILSTPVMQHTRNFLIKKGKVGKDPKEFKDLLRLIWFNMYSRGQGRIGSSGFEHVFLAELKNNQVSGLHNWLYFKEEESKSNANYLGYMKKVDLGNKGYILKYHFTFRGIDKPVGSMFIGTSPELEIALYSTCFILRADKICPLKLNGNRFIIRTYTYRYRGKNTIGSAFPEI